MGNTQSPFGWPGFLALAIELALACAFAKYSFAPVLWIVVGATVTALGMDRAAAMMQDILERAIRKRDGN